MSRRLAYSRVVAGLLLTLILVPLLPCGVVPVSAQEGDDELDRLIAGMTVEERVGQLFLVTFPGDEADLASDIGELIQSYRVGGVVLLASNGNIDNGGDTASSVLRLVNQLQELAASAPAQATAYPGLSEADESITPVPLFVALDHEGDGFPNTELVNEFTPVPSSMALGATWDAELAQAVGEVVGQELSAAGVNMLLGPSLDVLDTPRPGIRGDLGVRTFGGDPYWVGRLGEAYIRGVHLGGQRRVATVAKHFPGHGGSDRRADEEVSTVNKSLQELYRIELAPFFATTQEAKLGSPSATDALMTSHIRYRGFQGNIRQLTRPISFDAQNLPALMRLPEFVPWREEGGILVSDSLGVMAVRRYYDPQLQTFPYRQIAQEAFLAGNDLLLLSQFALHDDWEEQFENIKATIAFFQDKYVRDTAFRQRVDESLRRILSLKLTLCPDLTFDQVVRGEEGLDVIGAGTPLVSQVAKGAITLIYPGPGELADRLPSPPLPDEPILIFSDARILVSCLDPLKCPRQPAIDPTLMQRVMLQLYGPNGSRQVQADMVNSLTFSDLHRYVEGPALGAPGSEVQAAQEWNRINQLVSDAKWLVFAMLDFDTERSPNADILRRFLRMSESQFRNKYLIVFAFSEPYYLDTTEISKLTAYYGLYSRMPPFIEVAVRTLFQEITPRGASPVTINGINYDLITATEPDPSQVIQVKLAPLAGISPETTSIGISVGGTLRLATSPILDHNGHSVPDGTPVEFRLYYPAESLELPRMKTTTVDGVAEVAVVLDRTGQLDVTASSGSATRSTTLQVTIEGDAPAQIATVVPTATFTPPPTHTPRPTATPAATIPMSQPSATPEPSPTPTRVPLMLIGPVWPNGPEWDALGLSLLTLLAMSGVVGLLRGLVAYSGRLGFRFFLWLMAGGLLGYVLFVQGILPAATFDPVPEAWRLPALVGVSGLVVGLISLLFEPRREPGLAGRTPDEVRR